MDPNTLILAASSIALLLGTLALLKKHYFSRKKRIKDAKKRALRRDVERKPSDLDPYQAHDPYQSDLAGLDVKHHGKGGLPLDDEQEKVIDLIFEGYALPAKHRPVFITGASPLETAGVPLNESAFDDLNSVWPKRQEAVYIKNINKPSYLKDDFEWPEEYYVESNNRS